MVRYTNCWLIQFTSARSATSRSAIPDSTKRFFPEDSGKESSGSTGMRHADTELQIGLLPVLWRERSSTAMVSHSTCGERPRPDDSIAIYVSKRLVNRCASDNGKGWRLAAPEIERAVTIAARHIRSDRAGLLGALEKSGIDSPDVRATLELTSNLLRQLQTAADSMACVTEVIDRVHLRDDGISVTLGIQVPCSRAGIRTNSIFNLSRFLPVRMKRCGVETRIITTEGEDLRRKVDPALLKLADRHRAAGEDSSALRRASLASFIRRAPNRRTDLPGTSAR